MSQDENKEFEVIYNRLLPHKFTIPAAWGTLAVFSTLFYKKAYLINCLSILRQNLFKSVNLNQLSKNDTSLVYATGKLQRNATPPLTDKFFGVTTKSTNSMGIYTKYEVYSKIEPKKFDWVNINQRKVLPYDLDPFRSSVSSLSEIKVEDHTLSQSLLIELAEQNSVQLSLKPTEVDTYFESLKKKIYQEHQSENPDNSINQLYQNHPFSYAIRNYKDIYYEDNYIYVCNNSAKPSEFDFRISLHEIQNVAEVTLLAFKEKNFFKEYDIPELSQRECFLRIKNELGKHTIRNIALVNFIQKGYMKHGDVIQKIFMESSQKAMQMTLLYAFAVYILYQYMCEQIGAMIDFRNWSEEYIEELARKMVSKQGNDKIIVDDPQFNTMAVGFISSALHLSCNALFAYGHFSSFIIGGSLVAYWFYVYARKAELEIKINGEIFNIITFTKQFGSSQPQDVQPHQNLFEQLEFVKN